MKNSFHLLSFSFSLTPITLSFSLLLPLPYLIPSSLFIPSLFLPHFISFLLFLFLSLTFSSYLPSSVSLSLSSLFPPLLPYLSHYLALSVHQPHSKIPLFSTEKQIPLHIFIACIFTWMRRAQSGNEKGSISYNCILGAQWHFVAYFFQKAYFKTKMNCGLSLLKSCSKQGRHTQISRF